MTRSSNRSSNRPSTRSSTTLLPLGTLLAFLLTGASAAPVGAAIARAPQGVRVRALCHQPARLQLRCRSYVRLDGSDRPARTTAPAGYGPAQLRRAYAIPASSGDGLVAVVTAYDDPSAAADLATYRSTYGLPPCGPGCLSIIGQDGGSVTATPDQGWAGETALDLAMVSTGCPTCRITVVEAVSASLRDLATAERTAAALPSVLSVSGSFGAPESAAQQSFAPAFRAQQPGTWVVHSSGDDGYGVEFPAAVPGVVAVGGTSLFLGSDGRVVAERAWSGAGSGCSLQGAAPAWQPAGPCGSRRAVSDVAAVADPATGVAVYATYGAPRGSGGWLVVGGTSASAPFIAGLHAAAHSGSSSPASLYSGVLRDITSGSSGRCRPKARCTAGPGWDGPTGVGVPAGLAGL
jgi:subtilase family serine protease